MFITCTNQSQYMALNAMYNVTIIKADDKSALFYCKKKRK